MLDNLYALHYRLTKERDSWYNPDPENLNDINERIEKCRKLIDAHEETENFIRHNSRW